MATGGGGGNNGGACEHEGNAGSSEVGRTGYGDALSDVSSSPRSSPWSNSPEMATAARGEGLVAFSEAWGSCRRFQMGNLVKILRSAIVGMQSLKVEFKKMMKKMNGIALNVGCWLVLIMRRRSEFNYGRGS